MASFSSSEFFLKYMWEERRSQSMPVIKAAADWDSVKAIPQMDIILKQMSQLWAPHYPYRSGQPSYILSENVQRIQLGELKAEEALKKAQSESESWMTSRILSRRPIFWLTMKREHPVWRAAADEQCVMNMPMRELIKVNRVTAAAAAGAGHAPSVYVVENSGVFSALLDAVPDASLVCTHGQFKLAGLYLLDLLAKAGHTLFYSGDFDPEGLAMAVRFKERYGEQAQLWRMSIDDFHASSPVVELGDRESKLHSLLDSELGKVAQAVKETGRAGYQEGIVTLLIEDLRNRRMFNNV
ncbi:DUF2399 domain-containing protein [Paenibacillus algicola]|nr:DUF2399 domain-containing protein [Paenibacillus algicola]